MLNLFIFPQTQIDTSMKNNYSVHTGGAFRRFFFSLCLFFGSLALAQTVPAPQIGDFQSAATGNWNTAATW